MFEVTAVEKTQSHGLIKQPRNINGGQSTIRYVFLMDEGSRR